MIKIRETYSKIPLPAKASFWFLICGILQNGLNIITLPIFTRVLTTEQYGLSSTYFAWNDLFVVICTLRLSYGVFDKGMVKYEETRDSFESSILGLTTTVSLTMLVIFLLFHELIEKMLGMNIVLCFSLFACQIFSPALLYWTARNRYEYKYRKFAIVTVLSSLTASALNLIAVLAVHYDRGITKIISYQIVWSAINIVFYISIFVRGKRYYDKEIWKYALRFNIPLLPHFLSTIVLDKADRIIIKQICGQSAAALYSVSYSIGKLMILVTSALDATFTPWLYQKLKEKNWSNVRQVSFFILLGVMGLATCFMLFAPELLIIFADRRYKNAVYVIPPVIAGYFCVMLYGIVSKLEFYFEKTKSVAIITLMASVVDVILNYILIPKYGYIAAGYTTLLSYVVMAIAHIFYSYHLVKVKLKDSNIFPWKIFVFLIVIMIVITVFVNILYRSMLLRYLLIGLGLTVVWMFRKKIMELKCS